MLKRSTIFIIFFLVSSCSHSQDLKVSFIKTVPDPRHNTKDSTIVFPVFKFNDSKLSRKINLTLEKDLRQFHDIADSIKDIRAMLKEVSSQGLVSLDYKQLRNDKRFFSFYLGVEWMAAYPTYNETYYCFDKMTGNLLTLDSLIAPEKKIAFLNALRSQQKKRIREYKKEMLANLRNKEIDKEVYDWVISEVKNDCWDYYNPKEFKVFPDKIEIIIDCGFPHVIQAMSPLSALSFSLASFRQYLKPKYKSL